MPKYEGPSTSEMASLSFDSREAVRSFMWQAGDDCADADPSPGLVTRIAADWRSFREKAEAMGFNAHEHIARMCASGEGDPWGYAAHDFILTRNRHGIGFWGDGRWAEPWGDKLTALAESFGELGAYLGDDGLVYAE
jgi:hypothetical protein